MRTPDRRTAVDLDAQRTPCRLTHGPAKSLDEHTHLIDYDLSTMLIDPQLDMPSWTFLTNHAHVLIAISHDPELRQRDIAHVVGITPGAVVRILHDLEENGYVTAERVGRRNRYQINRTVKLRHPLESEHAVGDLIDSLAD